ncbi:hypothetical protein EYF80_062641 [Liparis tanakae]|uniref:Uncharacterized protein n=1 Tax=Liparis tanakae TaxID=230148 RepID=A0A4Z2EEB3_9TELE|nr:hypothetical protein EYF80_062641 [Liparis tanakae]
MILNNADQEQFARWLTECVTDMAQVLQEELKETNILMKLKDLCVKPQNELFTKLIGCDRTFRCDATNGETHHFKDYKAIFPDWKITPDGSLEASDYWKYVLVKFNKKFAKAFKAEPADIPVTWNMITPQQAEESLKESFNIK